MNVVVDASVAIKWFLAEDHTADAESLISSDFDIHAPELAISEFGNIVWKKLRYGDVQTGEGAAIVDAFFKVGINFHSNGPLLSAAVEIAVESGQTVYDCTYLALAIALDCPVITADRKFFLGLRNTRFRNQIVWIENINALIKNS